MNAMQKSEKDRLADEVVDRWVSFQMALSNKRKYPAREFDAFSTSVRRRRVPDAVIYEASRLENLLFSGYDLQFGVAQAAREGVGSPTPRPPAPPCPPPRNSQIPERSGLPSGVRGVAAARFGLPSGFLGTSDVG